MKLLLMSTLCLILAQSAAAQTAPASRLSPGALPDSVLKFAPIGKGVAVSAEDAFIGYPFCSGDGTIYLDALLPPDHRQQSLIAISSKGALSSYNLGALPGLVYVTTLNIDAEGPDLYALVTAAKADVVRDHGTDPGSSEASQYAEYFILRFKGNLSAPDEIPLDVKFDVQHLAALSNNEFVVLGFEQANQIPVIAVVDDSGDVNRYLDAYRDFGSDSALIANAPQDLKKRNFSKREQLEFDISAAQFAHYGDSLLLMMPGPKAKVFTIRSGGGLQSTNVNLPAGLEADSLIPSDKYWFLRVTDEAANGMKELVMVDPSSGDVLRIIRSPGFPVADITCIHDGSYYGIHWAGPKGNEKMFLMRATQ